VLYTPVLRTGRNWGHIRSSLKYDLLAQRGSTYTDLVGHIPKRKELANSVAVKGPCRAYRETCSEQFYFARTPS